MATVQMTVRLPDDVARFIDRRVKDEGISRAAAITAALRQEMQREAELRDARIYAAMAGRYDPDQWDALAGFAARQHLDID